MKLRVLCPENELLVGRQFDRVPDLAHIYGLPTLGIQILHLHSQPRPVSLLFLYPNTGPKDEVSRETAT